jgi:MinD-like ATPase involved in chromosome partitioning or flagellar assembly
VSYVISWVGTKDGQGLTTTMLSVAFEIAHSHSVLVVDADMSGTSTALDHLHLHPQGRGMNNLVGMSKITQDTLLRQVIQTRHPRVHLVPGLMAICGTGIADFIGQLERGGALTDLPYDFVLFDMGAAWSHALLESPRSAAQAVGRISARVFVLMQDSPARIARSIQVLQAAQPPRAEIVLMETRGGALSQQVRDVLAARLPSIALAARVRWEPRRAVAAENAGVPISRVGEEVVRGAQIVDRARAVLHAMRRLTTGEAGAAT